MATERLRQFMMPARHTKLCFSWRPLFVRTRWTCLNPPLLIIGFIRPPTDSRKVIMFTSVFFDTQTLILHTSERHPVKSIKVWSLSELVNWNRTFRPLFPSCNVQLSYHRRQLQTDLQNFWAKTVFAYFLSFVCELFQTKHETYQFSRYLRQLYW